MSNVTAFAPPVRARPDILRRLGPRSPAQPIRVTALGVLSLLCGTAAAIKLDFVGDVYLLEPLVALLALQCLLARGWGKGFIAPVFFGFVGAGFITFSGYVLSDLVAGNDPEQYLRGWGRVMFLIMDSAALMILAAHDRRNLWWLALGIGTGGVVSLLIEGVPLSQWKLGYAEYAVILVLALAPLFPRMLSTALIMAFGAMCVFLDYRSLGALCLLVGATMLRSRKTGQGPIWKSWLWVAAFAGVVALAVSTLLSFTQEQYAERRQESNIGRYVGIVVALRAIAESPIIGYGSWAENKKFARMFKTEFEAMDRDRQNPISIRRSFLPHSQILQVWIEGGLLGLAFFLFYGFGLIKALPWFSLGRQLDALTPISAFLVLSGLLNIFITPFLGSHRITIAMTVAVIAIGVYERRTSGR